MNADMRRILIIGSPGAGKSTFATHLSNVSHIPAIHLDKEYWQPGWVAPEAAYWNKKLAELISKPMWIIDGNYGASLAQRLRMADTIIHLNIPTHICLFHVIRRVIKWYSRQRPDMASGCHEKFNFSFFRQILDYRRRQLPEDKALLAQFSGTYVQLASIDEINALLRQIRIYYRSMP